MESRPSRPDRPNALKSPQFSHCSPSLLEALQPLLSAAAVDRAQLLSLSLADPAWCAAFGLSRATLPAFLETQEDWFCQWGLDFGEFWGQVCQRDPQTDRSWLVPLWRLWLPLAHQLQQKQAQQDVAWIQGILGVQGTGKTTLGKLLSWILERQGLRVVSLSLDDLYKTHADRQQLRAQEPRLRWRGPPGTHDVALGIAVLDQLRSSPPPGLSPSPAIALPRFDKSLWQGDGDRVAPEWVLGADIVLFEGWCVGMRPVTSTVLEQGQAGRGGDVNAGFAAWCNDRLGDYLPLWERLDDLLVLAPRDYGWSFDWRAEAEEQLRQAGKGAMNTAEVRDFVGYFLAALPPSLFLAPLLTDPRTGLVVELEYDRSLGAIYRPGDR